MKRRALVRIGVDIRAAVQEEPNSLSMVAKCRVMQWCHPLFVRCIELGILINKESYDLYVAPQRRIGQRCLTILVFFLDILARIGESPVYRWHL